MVSGTPEDWAVRRGNNGRSYRISDEAIPALSVWSSVGWPFEVLWGHNQIYSMHDEMHKRLECRPLGERG